MRSTRFAIQASPSWSEVQPIKDMSGDKYIGEVGIYIPYMRADYNSPLLIGGKDPEEDGERIREKLNQVSEARLLLEGVALIDPDKLSLEE